MIEKPIDYSDFEKVKMVTGTIIEAKINPKARKPAYVIKIDFGTEIGIKTSSAQITNYSIEELINRQIVAVINFEKKNIAGVESEVLILGAVNKDNSILLLSADKNFLNGLPIV
jgi:tRNA-binding protein|tara:strand:+ start:2944 stop:3285 length:342 start_codon:yes stop_codon:yes gene_type:complete